MLFLLLLVPALGVGAASSRVMVTVLPVSVISPIRAAHVLHTLFPNVAIRVDSQAHAVIVTAASEVTEQMRSVLSGIDVRDPTRPTVAVVPLQSHDLAAQIARIRALYPHAHLEALSHQRLLIKATPHDMEAIHTLLSALDAPVPTTAPSPRPIQAFQVRQALPTRVARTLVRMLHGLKANVSGSTILIAGPPELLAQVPTLLEKLDVPAFGAKYTEIYRLLHVDATSVARLVEKGYPNAHVVVDAELNALSVTADANDQSRIATAVAQLDGVATGPGAQAGPSAFGDGNIAVVELRAALPGQDGAPSTSAQDIATAVTQALGQLAPDLRVTVPANAAELVLAGSPQSIHLAEDLITKLDKTPALVVLDTEVLEIDESVAKNIGLQLPQAVLSSTFSEILPLPDVNGAPGRIGRLLPITRTPLQLTAQLNLLVQHGNARVLADPRITTLSGHTATIRAGDTLAILTTTGGSVGTPVTQQLQTFNTGVTLSITPMVSGKHIIVNLHPVVNSLSGLLNGVPQIATRDTQTMVSLEDNQTLVIGGLIQSQVQHTTDSIPILGDLPLIGGLFRNETNNVTRNELVIVVTPHLVHAGEALPPPEATQALPTPQPLPTLPPTRRLPIPVAAPLPAPTQSPNPVLSARLFTPTPVLTPHPQPTPTALAQANVFEIGTPPQSAYAGPGDSPQIFYARFAPNVLHGRTPVTISVITTTNVTNVTIGSAMSTQSLQRIGPSQWQATYTLDASSLPTTLGSVMLLLRATRSDGLSATLQIPVNILP